MMRHRQPEIWCAVACLVVLGLTATNTLAESWEGIWAAEKSWCKFKDQIGEHDPAPIKLNRNEFIGLENWCKVVEISSMNKELELQLRCAGEGEEYDDSFRIRVVSGKLIMKRKGEQSITFTRCR